MDTLLETAIIARAQFLTARAYKDVQGMIEAIEISLALDQDLISILEDTPFEIWELGVEEQFPRPPGTAEGILVLMKKLKKIYTASFSNLLKTVPYDIPELEERRIIITDHKMDAVGKYFRMLKRLLKKRHHAWKPSYEKTFSSMLRLRSPSKKR